MIRCVQAMEDELKKQKPALDEHESDVKEKVRV